MKDIFIFGTGGFAQEVLWTIEDINSEKKEWNFQGFIDENQAKWGGEAFGYQVFSPDEVFSKKKNFYLILGMGGCYTKYLLVKKYKYDFVQYPNLIHPSVIQARTCKILGVGNVIQAGTILAPNSQIHNFVTLNLAVTFGHDSIANDYCTLAPGVRVSGFVNIGVGSDIGTGTAIIQGLNIGRECIIGANAAVVKDIPDNSLAVGVPAKVIKNTEKRIID